MLQQNRILALVFAVALNAISIDISAQIDLTRYDTATIYLQSNNYIKNGQEYPLGFFFNNIEPEMAVSPDAVLELKKATNKRIVAFALSFVSVGLIAGAFATDERGWQIGLGLAGIATTFVGASFSRQSNDHIFHSVWLRNRAVLE